MAEIEPLRVRNRYLELLELGKVKFTKLQAEWLNYRDHYSMYRGALDKKQRQRIMEQITRIREKINKSGG
jgi:CRISPR/Cas system-associated endoribonuclease Cas2